MIFFLLSPIRFSPGSETRRRSRFFGRRLSRSFLDAAGWLFCKLRFRTPLKRFRPAVQPAGRDSCARGEEVSGRRGAQRSERTKQGSSRALPRPRVPPLPLGALLARRTGGSQRLYLSEWFSGEVPLTRITRKFTYGQS